VGGDTQEGLYTVTMKRAVEFGTRITCSTSKSSDAVLKAMIAAQKAALASDAAGIEKARAEVQKALTITFIQAIRTYANEMYLDQKSDQPILEHQTEAYVFFRTIAPLLAAANANTSAALDYWLFPGQPANPDIDVDTGVAIAAAYKGLGITEADIGKYGNKQAELKCAEYVPAGAGAPGGIVSTTTAKDDVRGGAAAAPAAAPVAAPGRRLRFWSA